MALREYVKKSVKLQVTHESKKYDIVLDNSEESQTLEDLAKQVEISTGVPLHKQRLIHKGKSLCEMTATLKSLGIKSGSKVMLIGKKLSEEDEGHLTAMKEVESKVDDTKNKLGEIEAQVTDIQRGFLASELHQEALKNLNRRLLGCIEAFQRQLEQLDAISLARATSEVQNRRKSIVKYIQDLLQQADNLQENITTLKVLQQDT